MSSQRERAIEHIAIIPDGNRRYAKKADWSLFKTYSKAIRVFLRIIEVAQRKHVNYITFFCLSKQNLIRTPDDLEPLFKSLRFFISKILLSSSQPGSAYLWFKNNCKFRIIGEVAKSNLVAPYYSSIKRIHKNINLINKYQHNTNRITKINVTLAINYGAQEEIASAIKQAQQHKNLKRPPESFLQTNYLPPVDICIRTGNVCRVSNFLLLKLAYSELFFLKCLWPEFTCNQFLEVIEQFKTIRQPRFGK